MTGDRLFQILFAVQLFSTFAMTGLIYLIQFVHYPLFDRVDAERFAQFEADHSNRITFIVLPLMTAELGTAGYLAAIRSSSPDRLIWFVLFGLVLAIWASTFLLSVPEHTRLMRGFDAAAHRRLVVTNWPRTILWTVRSGLLVWAFLRFFRVEVA